MKSCSARVCFAGPPSATRRSGVAGALRGGTTDGGSANPFALADQTILIAGAASGNGPTTAAACAALGAELVLADIADAAPVAEKLRQEGRAAIASRCDVTDRAAVERLVAEAGAIDAMIVCSGICPFDE